MPERKWLWIDIKAPEQPIEKEDLLLLIHTNVVSTFRICVENWHFLWESAPFQHTLLIRFCGDAKIIQKIKDAITSLLDSVKIEWKIEPYEGEANTYGPAGWEYLTRVLHLGSEFAIALMENKRSPKSEEFKRSLSGYLERWIHLFMNQLSTRLEEAPVLFQLSIHRTTVNILGEKEYREIAKDLDKEISQLWNQSYDEAIVPLISRLVEAKKKTRADFVLPKSP